MAACDDGGTDPTPEDTRCGTGPLTFQLGTGNPFTADPDQTFLIEAGLQGGYHFDVSVRTQGSLDPDLVDVELVLKQGEVVRARHIITEWLLAIDGSGPWCDYTRARLVLVDEAGSLLPRDQLEVVAAGPLTLEVTMTSPLGGGQAELPLTLTPTPGI